MTKPSVPRHWLFLIAGLLWTAAGLTLLARAYSWIALLETGLGISLVAAGLALAFIFFRYIFIKVVRKNMSRIESLPDEPCVFAFTAWKGYILIAAMVALGIMARNSPVPKVYLSVVYVAMGGALMIGSFSFHKKFYSAINSKKENR